MKCHRLPGQEKVCSLLILASTFTFAPVSGNSLRYTQNFRKLCFQSIACQKTIHARQSSPFYSLDIAIGPTLSSHFVQQATSEKKRSAVNRRPRNLSSASTKCVLSIHLCVLLLLRQSKTNPLPVAPHSLVYQRCVFFFYSQSVF